MWHSSRSDSFDRGDLEYEVSTDQKSEYEVLADYYYLPFSQPFAARSQVGYKYFLSLNVRLVRLKSLSRLRLKEAIRLELT